MAVQWFLGRNHAILVPESVGRIVGYGPTARTAKHPRVIQGEHGLANVTSLVVSENLGPIRDDSDASDFLGHPFFPLSAASSNIFVTSRRRSLFALRSPCGIHASPSLLFVAIRRVAGAGPTDEDRRMYLGFHGIPGGLASYHKALLASSVFPLLAESFEEDAGLFPELLVGAAGSLVFSSESSLSSGMPGSSASVEGPPAASCDPIAPPVEIGV